MFYENSSQGQRSKVKVKVKYHQDLITTKLQQFLISSFFHFLHRQTDAIKNNSLPTSQSKAGAQVSNAGVFCNSEYVSAHCKLN